MFLCMNIYIGSFKWTGEYRPLRYERVYLPLCEVADTLFHGKYTPSYLGDDM